MAAQNIASSNNIRWDIGTAYELFISLHVLNEPEEFGLRASWAAGVRSRIPAEARKILEDFYSITGIPIKWLSTLPEPKDAITALWALKQIPPAERLLQIYKVRENCVISGNSEKERNYQKIMQIILRVTEDRAWAQTDLNTIFDFLVGHEKKTTKEKIKSYLDWCSRPEELGEAFLGALQFYYQAFFEEEEKRVAPVLAEGLERAKDLATKMDMRDLFSELSQGVQLNAEFQTPNYVLVPAFWTTPLIIWEHLDKDTTLLFFGARPASMSAIPGELVPDGLVRTLKALGDPSRLKILNYLSQEELTPSELARRLHLRAPTVTHHLRELRLSGLVKLNIQDKPQGQEKRYSARIEALDVMCNVLKDFLQVTPEK
jgi:DNA-binding transcriptional ArsR family regulator